MILYKYLPVERLDVLTGRRIRYTQFEAMNDLFEGRLRLSDEYANAYFSRNIEPSLRAAFNEVREGIRTDGNFTSLSEGAQTLVKRDRAVYERYKTLTLEQHTAVFEEQLASLKG